MSKKKNSNEAVVDEATSSTVEGSVDTTTTTSTEQASVTVTEPKKAPGRPVDPTSARQQKLALKGQNPGKRGRPVKEGCARQIRLANMKAKADANGGVLQRGRPKMDPAVKAANAAKRAAEKAQAAIDAANSLKSE